MVRADWLNVGCGDRPFPAPWVNCDLWPGVGPDVVMDATAPWPVRAGSVERVYMGQVIEHLPYPEGVTAALANAAEVLALGGTLAVVCPDFDALEEKRCEQWIRDNLTRGECRWPGDEHRWCPTRHRVAELVGAVLPGARVVPPSTLLSYVPAGGFDPWDCAVVAVKT